MVDAYCDFSDLTDFQKNLLAKVKDEFPKETKDFLQAEAKKLQKIAVSTAKTLVKTKTGNYLNGYKTGGKGKKRGGFRIGNVYQYGGSLSSDTCIRVYNNAHHAHLIETGHKTQNGGYVQGKHVLETSEKQFMPDFTKDCADFLEDFTGLVTK